MTAPVNRQILLASRPAGEPTAANFELVESAMPAPTAGEVLVRSIYLSLDPYMRGRMNDTRSYAQPVPVGGVMEGGVVGEVVESNFDGLAPGDIVNARLGWQSHGLAKGESLRKVDPSIAPISTAIGILGMPGMTAFTGLKHIGKPQSGETLVVGAASGAVGAVVGQIGKIHGCRVVGIAGTEDKCRYVTEELGFDACLDHRAPELGARLEAACPDGIDIYWENIGGDVFKAVIPLFNDFARMPVCGIISHYNDVDTSTGLDYLPMLEGLILRRRLRFQGFIVSDYLSDHDDFLSTSSAWLRDGRLKYREDYIDGLENAPNGLIGLLNGRNFGKLIVRVSADPTL